MIVQQLNESYFMDRFNEMGRGDQFSYEALEALFNYYEELSEDLGEDIKLDVIAICCDWYESTLEDVIHEYSIDIDEDQTVEEAVEEYLTDNAGTYFMLDGTVLYQAF